jgi:hypothetical protein
LDEATLVYIFALKVDLAQPYDWLAMVTAFEDDLLVSA